MELKGADDALVKKVLAGKSPRQRAAELVAGTQLKDVAVRKQLAEGGVKAAGGRPRPDDRAGPAGRRRRRGSSARPTRRMVEALQQAYAKMAKARFALEGTNVYPDATFTLRLAFGVVKGYTAGRRPIPPWTTLGGAYQHAEAHGGRPPFALPKRWMERKDRLDLRTPLNFLSTADIIGGNSGSPVVNRAGEFVGIIFDGNLHSLVWDFIYDDKRGPRHRRPFQGDRRGPAQGLRRRGAGRRIGEIAHGEPRGLSRRFGCAGGRCRL